MKDFKEPIHFYSSNATTLHLHYVKIAEYLFGKKCFALLQHWTLCVILLFLYWLQLDKIYKNILENPVPTLNLLHLYDMTAMKVLVYLIIFTKQININNINNVFIIFYIIIFNVFQLMNQSMNVKYFSINESYRTKLEYMLHDKIVTVQNFVVHWSPCNIHNLSHLPRSKLCNMTNHIENIVIFCTKFSVLKIIQNISNNVVTRDEKNILKQFYTFNPTLEVNVTDVHHKLNYIHHSLIFQHN